MKKQIILGAGALALAAVPAVIGLWGNSSFAESVPVRVPESGQIATPAPTVSTTPSASPSVDDHGDVPRDQRVEPGDDRDVQGVAPTVPAAPVTTDDRGGDDQRVEPGDDRGANSGSGSSGGSGSDDSGHSGDDRGGHGHGGDD